jgi:hypothetical protein
MVAELETASRILEEGRQILLGPLASVGSLAGLLEQLHRNPFGLTDQILHSVRCHTLVRPVVTHTPAAGSSLVHLVGWTYPGEVKVDEVDQRRRLAGMADR